MHYIRMPCQQLPLYLASFSWKRAQQALCIKVLLNFPSTLVVIQRVVMLSQWV